LTKDGKQIYQKRSVRNARRPKRCNNKDHGHHHARIHQRTQKRAGGAFTKLKSTHFAEGQRYGFLATAIPEEKYRIVISDATWNNTAPDNPGAYATAALVAGVSTAQQEQLVAQHSRQHTPITSARKKWEKNYSYTGWATTRSRL